MMDTSSSGLSYIRDQEHVKFLTKAADEADRGECITLTGMSDEQMLTVLFGDDQRL